MAVKLITAITNYVGANADTKPTGVAVGSTYLEYDTDARFITYDGTNWVQISEVSVAIGSIAAGSNIIGKVGVDQTTPGTTNRVMAGGLATRVSVEKTRTADTDAYTAKDVYAEATSGATVWTFTSIARATGGSGYIVKASVHTDQTTCVETFKLHLFNASPTALQDNAACTAPLYANASSYVGSILFPACSVEGTGSTAAYANAVPGASASVNLPMKFVCNADANLYGIVETVLGFTPASAQKLTVTLVADVD